MKPRTTDFVTFCYSGHLVQCVAGPGILGFNVARPGLDGPPEPSVFAFALMVCGPGDKSVPGRLGLAIPDNGSGCGWSSAREPSSLACSWPAPRSPGQFALTTILAIASEPRA